MIKFIKYWFTWVLSFVTVDGLMELGGFGTIYHQNLSDDIFMVGFFFSFIIACLVTAIIGSTLGDKI